MEPENQQQKNLSKEQKIAFSFLLLIGILAVGLGFLQIRNNIFSPFVIKPDFNSGPSATQFFKDSETRLQKIDTDKDGLSDYEEINFHNTSRFIPDTDSDGIDDGEEVEQGSDPLCPEGESCANQYSQNNNDSTTTIQGPLSNDSSAPDILKNASNQAQQASEDMNSQNNSTNTGTTSSRSVNAGAGVNMQSLLQNPDKLREAMKKNSSVPDEKIDQIDDETLIKAAKRIIQQQDNNQQ